MSHKIKPVRRLGFQFQRELVTPRLGADEIAVALCRAGLIEGVIFGKGGKLTHYVETERLTGLTPDAFRLAIRNALLRYAAQSGTRAEPRYPQLSAVRAHSDGTWTAECVASELDPREQRKLGLHGSPCEQICLAVGTWRNPPTGLSLGEKVSILGSDVAITVSLLRFDETALRFAVDESSKEQWDSWSNRERLSRDRED